MHSEKQPIWQLDWAIGTVLYNHAIVCLLNFKLPWSTEWWEGTSRTFVVNDYKLHCIVVKWLRFWWTLQRGTKNKVTPGVWYEVVMLCSISLQDDKTISVTKQSSCDHLLDLFEAWNLLTLPRGEIRKVHEVGKAPCKGYERDGQLLGGGMGTSLFICSAVWESVGNLLLRSCPWSWVT